MSLEAFPHGSGSYYRHPARGSWMRSCHLTRPTDLCDQYLIEVLDDIHPEPKKYVTVAGDRWILHSGAHTWQRAADGRLADAVHAHALDRCWALEAQADDHVV